MHSDALKQTLARRALVLGLQHYSRCELEHAAAAGQMLHVQVVGLARIADDVTPALARATIASVSVLGAFQASASVKQALADRIVQMFDSVINQFPSQIWNNQFQFQWFRDLSYSNTLSYKTIQITPC